MTLIVAVKTLDKSLFNVADDDGMIPEGLSELEQLTRLSFRGCHRTGERAAPVADKGRLKSSPRYVLLNI